MQVHGLSYKSSGLVSSQETNYGVKQVTHQLVTQVITRVKSQVNNCENCWCVIQTLADCLLSDLLVDNISQMSSASLAITPLC